MFEENELTMTATRYRCVSCGHQDFTTVVDGCPICSGRMLADLGVELDQLIEGADLLSVHRVLARYAQVCNIEFSLGDHKIRSEQVFQPEAMLPIISIEAMRIWQSVEHRPGQKPSDRDTLDVDFDDSLEGFFPLAAYPAAIGPDTTSTLRLLVFLLAARRVLGMKENSKIDLVRYISKWDQIDWEGDTLPEIPIPEGFDLGFQHREFVTQKVSQQQTAKVIPTSVTVVNPFASQHVKE